MYLQVAWEASFLYCRILNSLSVNVMVYQMPGLKSINYVNSFTQLRPCTSSLVDCFWIFSHSVILVAWIGFVWFGRSDRHLQWQLPLAYMCPGGSWIVWFHGLVVFAGQEGQLSVWVSRCLYIWPQMRFYVWWANQWATLSMRRTKVASLLAIL
jgi:hypothetical protein